MLTITEQAKEQLIKVLQEENHKIIRFGIKGGGCNGFQYYFGFEDNKEEDDDSVITIEDDFIMVVDSLSLMYVDSVEIGYKKDMMGESFTFSNPQSTGKCGCGSSVSF